MSKKIFVIGAGGHAKVLIEALLANKEANLAGALELDDKLIGQSILNVPILSQQAMLAKYPPGDVVLVNGVGSVRSTEARQKVFKHFKALNYRFMSIIHPTAYMANDVMCGEGCQVLARSTVLSGTILGDNVIVNTNASVDHDCHIGDHTHVAPRVVFSGRVHLGESSHVGTGAIVIQDVKIGERVLWRRERLL